MFARSAAVVLAALVALAPVPLPAQSSPDSALAAARAALAVGRPWQASRLLLPILKDSTARTPEAELLAAKAAAAWGGWKETERLLRGRPWLDTRFDGEGHELLARANLGLRRDAAALEHARKSLADAPSPEPRGPRLVLLARAQERLRDHAAAAGNYAAAAEALPTIAPWLLVRAVSVQQDSALRGDWSARITDSLARARLPLAEAQRLERSGDTARAIGAYTEAGQPLAALRLRAAGADSARRAVIRRELLGYVTDRSGSAAARTAVRLLDSLEFALAPAEQLQVARSAARSGPLSRAADAYAAVFAAGAGTASDRFAYADVLFRLGRYAEAVRWYRRVEAPPTLAAQAAYREARSYVRDGRGAEGQALLDRIVRTWPDDSAAAQALYLRADLHTDALEDSAARATFLRLVERHPGHRLAPSAAFRAAVIALIDGDVEAAARELDALRSRWPGSTEVPAALYWAGRAWSAAGDTATATARWQAAMAWDQASYYAELSSRRLGVPPWAPAPAIDSFATVPSLDSTAARAELLEHLGLDDEATAERARFARDAAGDAERLLAAADIARRRGLPSQAIRLAMQAQKAGARKDARLYRLLYPLAFEDALKAESGRRQVDGSLVAALIRQESLYDPAATSSAGARGLMQLLPDVGRQVARGLSYATWDPVLLYQPDVNIELGTAHLADLLAQRGNVVEVLAAYNAGAHRVVRWRTKPGTDDPEVLAERIPYTETRDYVRIIQRNRALYRALYPWEERVIP
ncbi:MAG: transglycosylase SLT domain-containing protein [Gemmatimonadales bacterium]|nr:transglycosylase SLT domain-containing protein [Gemmatimonadales bacterium]